VTRKWQWKKRVTANIMPPCSKKTSPKGKSAKNDHSSRATTSQKGKAPPKNPPVRHKNPAAGKKRKAPNSKTNPNPKRSKTSSTDSEACPLTTADIPDIIVAVVDANRCENPAQVRTRRHTLRSAYSTSRDDPPSEDSQPSSDGESEEHEDFGNCNCITAVLAFLCTAFVCNMQSCLVLFLWVPSYSKWF